jgi:hypothetical protein
VGCGCGGRQSKTAKAALGEAPEPTAQRVAVYEVYSDDTVMLSTTSASAARTEAKRLNASVRVKSRAVAV